MSDEMEFTKEFIMFLKMSPLNNKWTFVSSHETENEIIIQVKRKTTHDLEDK
jgi:hypothetical protein